MSTNKATFFIVLVLFFVNFADAHEKTWPEKRLRRVWPEAQSFTSKQVTLTSNQVAELKNEGIQIGSEDRRPTFYFAHEKASSTDKKSKTLGAILFIDAAGENRIMEVSVAIGTDGRVKKIDIWEHSESLLIAEDNFLKQFFGKNSKDTFIVNQDYKPVAKAEKTSEAIADGVKKALKIFDVIFEKK